MGASAVTAAASASAGCKHCCSDEGRGQLTFNEGCGARCDEVLPEGFDPHSEFSKSCCVQEAAASANPPDGADDAERAFMEVADAIFSDSSSGRSEADGQDSAASTDADSADVRALVERFVRGLVKGSNVTVVAANGDLVECTLIIDRGVTTLSIYRTIEMCTRKRDIPLKHILKVVLGSEIGPHPTLPADDACVALVLSDRQMVAFSFPDVDERTAFMRCLSMFLGDQRVSLNINPQKDAAPQDKSTTRKSVTFEDSRKERTPDVPVSESFGLEDLDNVSVPECQETLATFDFEVEVDGSVVGGNSEVGSAPL